MSLPQMQPVTSSNIAAIGHDGNDLYVRFASGKTYRYADVPAGDHDAFINADSHGKHFVEHIKNNYDGVQV